MKLSQIVQISLEVVKVALCTNIAILAWIIPIAFGAEEISKFANPRVMLHNARCQPTLAPLLVPDGHLAHLAIRLPVVDGAPLRPEVQLELA